MTTPGPPAPAPSPAARPPPADVPAELVREILHRVNNVAARLLLRSEIALETMDPEARHEALRAAAAAAEELGSYIRDVRARLRELHCRDGVE